MTAASLAWGDNSRRPTNGVATTTTTTTSIWDRAWMEKVPDPTRVLSVAVIAIMSGQYLHAHDGNVGAWLAGFVLNAYVLAFFMSACVTVIAAKPPLHSPYAATALPVYDRWVVEWYWWNSWLYHATMDGASGSFQLVPVVVHQYAVLDQRFVHHHVVPWTIGAMELFLHYPLCLATLYCVRSRHEWRYPLEIVTSSLHLFGMMVFVASEVYEGQLNIPALDPVGVPGHAWANVKFDVYHLTYYWFGFWICNFIWFFVPIWRVIRATQEIGAVMQAHDKVKAA